jgi:hypothetical protein
MPWNSSLSYLCRLGRDWNESDLILQCTDKSVTDEQRVWPDSLPTTPVSQKKASMIKFL